MVWWRALEDPASTNSMRDANPEPSSEPAPGCAADAGQPSLGALGAPVERSDVLRIGALLLVAFALRIVGISTLPVSFHEAGQFFHLLRGQGLLEILEPDFVYPLLFRGLHHVAGIQHADLLHFRIPTQIFSLLIVPLTYGLARAFTDRRRATYAAALVVLSPAAVTAAKVPAPHAIYHPLVLFTLIALVRVMHPGALPRVLLAPVGLLALAALTYMGTIPLVAAIAMTAMGFAPAALFRALRIPPWLRGVLQVIVTVLVLLVWWMGGLSGPDATLRGLPFVPFLVLTSPTSRFAFGPGTPPWGPPEFALAMKLSCAVLAVTLLFLVLRGAYRLRRDRRAIPLWMVPAVYFALTAYTLTEMHSEVRSPWLAAALSILVAIGLNDPREARGLRRRATATLSALLPLVVLGSMLPWTALYRAADHRLLHLAHVAERSWSPGDRIHLFDTLNEDNDDSRTHIFQLGHVLRAQPDVAPSLAACVREIRRFPACRSGFPITRDPTGTTYLLLMHEADHPGFAHRGEFGGRHIRWSLVEDWPHDLPVRVELLALDAPAGGAPDLDAVIRDRVAAARGVGWGRRPLREESRTEPAS